MARKKQEIALQRELNTQEEWDDAISKEGLCIIDVYQEWCGPCKSIVSHFRRIKNESGEDILQFAVARADTIDSLDRYRGNCKPCFLFYGSGTLVDVIRGVNPPVLETKIKLHLANELKVLKGEPGAERVEIRDPAFKHLDDAERLAKKKAGEEEEEEEIEREVTVVLIKPDAKHKVEEIKQKLEERGIEILEQQERKLTLEEARDFYRHLEGQEWFEQMINYMTTGESIVLVISKGTSGIISEFREILGPANVEEAKETQPDSLRAIFGSESFKNAIHAADSGEKAAKELEFFFPEFKVPTYKVHKAKKEKHREIEKTVALIRPDAFIEFKDEILAKIKEAGFAIALKKEVHLTKEQAEEFYSEKRESPFFGELITRMTNGPVLALALAKEDAVKEWRSALGEKDPKEAKTAHPHSLRAMYSREDIQINLLHGSDSANSAKKELEFFFPIEQTLVVIKPDAYENRDEIVQKAKEAEFIVAARKDLKLKPEMAREFYKAHAGKEFFEDLVAHMTSGKSVFLVLSRHDAIAGWRQLMGDPDPAKAAEDDHSIRSIFGKDIKSNAVHGSSNKDQAAEAIRLIFGNIQFDHDGNRVPGTGDVADEESQQESTEDEGEMRGPNGEIVRTGAQEAQPSSQHHEGAHKGGKQQAGAHKGGKQQAGAHKGGKGKKQKGKRKAKKHEDGEEHDEGEEGEAEGEDGEEGEEGEEGDEGEEGEEGDEGEEGEEGEQAGDAEQQQDEGAHQEGGGQEDEQGGDAPGEQPAAEHQDGGGQPVEHQDEAKHQPEHQDEAEHQPEHHEEAEQQPEHQDEAEHQPEHQDEAEHQPEHHEEAEHQPEHQDEVEHRPEHHAAEHQPEHHAAEHQPEHHAAEHQPEHHEAEHQPEHHEAEHQPEHHDAGGDHAELPGGGD